VAAHCFRHGVAPFLKSTISDGTLRAHYKVSSTGISQIAYDGAENTIGLHFGPDGCWPHIRLLNLDTQGDAGDEVSRVAAARNLHTNIQTTIGGILIAPSSHASNRERAGAQLSYGQTSD
jgi:hypothetical protein